MNIWWIPKTSLQNYLLIILFSQIINVKDLYKLEY